MEIGSHDRLQEGVLSLELANGVSPCPNDDEASMETEQQKVGSVPPRQSWVPGHGKVSDTQQHQPCWSNGGGATPALPVHHADMEDAHNLVAFSVTASSLPPSSSSSCQLVKINTTQLYERFIQETGAGGTHARDFAEAPEESCQPSEDLETLQTALSQAKHGHKPPNCNCDGPDCPDYLEWLEKKIKLATREHQGSHKTADGAPHSQQPNLQHHPQTYRQMNGAHHISNSCSQQQAVNSGPHQDQVPCSKPPIPCSPQVLSMVKEKNISLQAAIAIDALTQLSGSGPQAASSLNQTLFRNKFHSQQHTENMTHGLSLSSPTNTSSSRPQSVPSGLHTNQQDPSSCEHHRPQSQGHLPHATPFPSSTSPFPGQGKPLSFSYNPQQGKQGSGRELEQMNPWMYLKSETQPHFITSAHNKSDPMSELKQLLGDTSGKLKHAPFKLPVMQQLSLNQNGEIQGQVGTALARIKQESDSGENYHHTASVGQYGISDGQQQGQHYLGNPMSPGQAAISHSTQAALQHHLHYRRNLFSTHPSGFGAPGSRAPMGCQNLKKWWPQVDAEGLSLLQIKQEPKEPKKKKSSQGSPVIKSAGGMYLGPPLSKPKQIVIKKTKQKASMPTFLPQAQISVQKTPVHVIDRSPAPNSLQACSLPSLALLNNSTQAAVAGLPAPAQSQVSISNTSMTSSSTASVSSEQTPTLMNTVFQSVAPAVHNTSEDSGMSLTSSNTSNVTPVTSTSSSNTSQLQNLINIDPKFEELIRQFEAEFGDSVPDTSASQSKKEIVPGPKLRNQRIISPQDLSSTSSHTTKSVPSVSTVKTNPTPHSDDQEMVVNKNELGTQSETTMGLPNTDNTMEMQRQEPVDAFANQETTLDKQQPPRVLENTFSMQASPLPKRFKFEASGELAVLSTTCFSEEGTPSKDGLHSSPSLKGFLDSPLRYLDTPTKNLLDTPCKDQQSDFPTCTCVGKCVHQYLSLPV